MHSESWKSFNVTNSRSGSNPFRSLMVMIMPEHRYIIYQNVVYFMGFQNI